MREAGVDPRRALGLGVGQRPVAAQVRTGLGARRERVEHGLEERAGLLALAPPEQVGAETGDAGDVVPGGAGQRLRAGEGSEQPGPGVDEHGVEALQQWQRTGRARGEPSGAERHAGQPVEHPRPGARGDRLDGAAQGSPGQAPPRPAGIAAGQLVEREPEACVPGGEAVGRRLDG